jgi:putative restriction endonuclease
MPPASPCNDALSAFSRLRVWERDGERAPHKPLLALLALGRWAAGDRGPYRYTDVEGPLRELLVEFGPPRRRHHPEFPYWYLQTDGVWVVTPKTGYPPRKGHSSPSAKQLRERNASGQFAPTVQAALKANPDLVIAIALQLLAEHFPPSYHADILAAVGLDPEAPPTAKAARDPAFRHAVLVAYGYACAVCGVGLRLGHASIAVEAAHIRWHSCGGPDRVPNGLSLCSLHHKLFDRGALSLSPDGKKVWVSEHVNGPNAEEALYRFHDRAISLPNRAEARPAPAYVQWHHEEVFRGRPRD